MSFNLKEHRAALQVLLGCLLCIFLTGLFYVITFRRPSVLGLEVFSRSNGTRTALAMTSQALYGPFPTATGPSPTVTKTPTITPTATATPSNTPTPTPLRFFIDTATPRTPNPNHPTSISPPTSGSFPTNPPSQPTQPPLQPTQPPPQPTQPPIQPTRRTCVNPQGHIIPCH